MKLFLPVLICAACATSFAPQGHTQTPSQMAEQSTAVQSDPTKIAQIRRLLELMGVQERMPPMMQATTEQMSALTDSTTKSGDSSKTQQQRDQIKVLLSERMIAKIRALDVVGLWIPVYDKHYTADDISALIAFYESPVGKKTLQLEKKEIAVESMQTVMPVVEKLIKESEAEIAKEHPELGMPSDSHPTLGGIEGGETAAPTAPPRPGRVTRITRGGASVMASAITRVPPVYPELARQARVQGTVRLHIVIETEGHVIEVTYVSGPAMLVQAAIDAAKQWRFHPTLLDGVPVQVECVVELDFHLGK